MRCVLRSLPRSMYCYSVAVVQLNLKKELPNFFKRQPKITTSSRDTLTSVNKNQRFETVTDKYLIIHRSCFSIRSFSAAHSGVDLDP
jgi:hypothetical protein